MTTKERITEEALTLFSTNGYQGTSVKSIADAVGIRDASLYKHFKSKQEIFSSIVDLINTHIEGLSEQLGMPPYDNSASMSASFYKSLDLNGLKKLSEKVFLFYLTDSYISRFWRLSHMEQYRNPEIYDMFQRIFLDQAIVYQTQLFQEMMEQGVLRRGDPRAVAINFYSPIFLLLTKYSGQKEKTKEALTILNKQIEEFFRLYHID